MKKILPSKIAKLFCFPGFHNWQYDIACLSSGKTKFLKTCRCKRVLSIGRCAYFEKSCLTSQPEEKKIQVISKAVALSILLIFSCTLSFSQSKADSLLNKIDPQKFASSIGKKADKLQDKLVEKSVKTLDKLQGQEERLYKKMLGGKDSLLAKAKLSEIKEKYGTLKKSIKSPALVNNAKQYIPKLDSLTTSLKYLNDNGISGKVKDALSKTQLLQDKFQQAEQIKKFIAERREQLKQQLEKLGMLKQLKQINKRIYYYTAQINEYKDLLNDPQKIEKKALDFLSKTKLFKDFMARN